MHKAAHWMQAATFLKKQKPPFEGGSVEIEFR